MFCLNHGLVASPHDRLLDVQSELGEVSKAVLKATDYGREPLHATDTVREELGDLVFSVLQLANTLNVDLEEELRAAMKKYQRRIDATGQAGSGR